MIKKLLIGCLMLTSLSANDCQQSEIDSKQDCEINRLKQAVAKLIKESESKKILEKSAMKSSQINIGSVVEHVELAPVKQKMNLQSDIVARIDPKHKDIKVNLPTLKNIELNSKRCDSLANIEKSYIQYSVPRTFKTKSQLQVFEFPAIKAEKIGTIAKGIEIIGTHYTKGGWVKYDGGWVKGYVLTPSIYNMTPAEDVQIYNSKNNCKGEK